MAQQNTHFMRLGKIVRPHGIRGELRMELYTAYPERMSYLETVYLSSQRRPNQRIPYKLESVRFHRDAALLMLEGIADRTEAESLRGMLVSVPLDEGAPLEEGEYYVIELIGMDVYTDTDRYLGKLEDMFETGANDVYILRGTSAGDILIPDTPEVIHQIDFEQRRITITPLPGLLPDEIDPDDSLSDE